jgi:hypothetical protein
MDLICKRVLLALVSDGIFRKLVENKLPVEDLAS